MKILNGKIHRKMKKLETWLQWMSLIETVRPSSQLEVGQTSRFLENFTNWSIRQTQSIANRVLSDSEWNESDEDEAILDNNDRIDLRFNYGKISWDPSRSVVKWLNRLDLTNTISICSGWIVDGLTVNGTTAGGSSQRDQLQELDPGEKIIIIEGSHCGFENRQVIGQLKLTSSTGRTFGNVFYYQWIS